MSRITLISIYFSRQPHLFKCGVWVAIHRVQNGKQAVAFYNCTKASWSRLCWEINRRPGRLLLDINGATWMPDSPPPV